MAILPNLAQENEALKAIVAEMQAKLALASQPKRLSMKVTAKKTDDKGKTTGTNGAISFYGLGRFPVTLYRSQIERILDHADDIRAFIETNAALLAIKT